MIERKIDSSIVEDLYKPPRNSHKGDNGRLLIIGGSKKFHGAPLFAAKIASKIVDLVYFSSVPENNELIKKMKSSLAVFITIDRKEVFTVAEKVDAILIGPGLGISADTEKLTNAVLEKLPHKKLILDADSLKILDKRLLNPNCVVTPHKGEFEILFGKPATKKTVFEAAKRYNCIVVSKGAEDYISDGERFSVNTNGNAGMTKGGTGDVLAGLLAAMACKNDLFLAACVGVFINGLAGDRLKEKVSFYYNASDLIDEIPKTMAEILNNNQT